MLVFGIFQFSFLDIFIHIEKFRRSEAYDNENSSDTDASRRVYVREEFTHENSARGIRNAQDDENMRR